MNRQLEEKLKKYPELLDALEELESIVSTIQHEIDTAMNDINERDDKIERLEGICDDRQRKIDALEEIIGELEEEIQALKEKL